MQVVLPIPSKYFGANICQLANAVVPRPLMLRVKGLL